MAKIAKAEDAVRLARAIVSDILVFNQEKAKQGLDHDNIFEVLREEIQEGRELYDSRVSPELPAAAQIYDLALVDVLIKRCGHLKARIF